MDTTTVFATYKGDGILRLEEDVAIDPETRVRVTIEQGATPAQAPARSFLDVLQGLNLDGPADASTRLDEYLYGDGGRERTPLP